MFKTSILAALVVAASFSSITFAHADMHDRMMMRHAMHDRMEHKMMKRHMEHRMMKRHMMHDHM